MHKRIISPLVAALIGRATAPKFDGTIPTRMDMTTPYVVRSSVLVYLDGVLQWDSCIEADREAGYVIRYKFDKNGKKYVENGEAATERVQGKVEFKVRT